MSLRTIKANELKQWLESGEAVLIDVREPAEYNAGNIPGSKSVPLSTICKSGLPECSGKKLVIHCLKGMRGETACKKLLTEDPKLEIYNLEGGISSWESAGFPVKKSGSFFLPLDRQVQLTIGLLLLVGSVLGYYLSPIFFFLTGFLGLGLTLAGLTGFCGLAHIMARMPWNKG